MAPMDCGDFWPADGGIPEARTAGAFPCREYDPRDPSLAVGPYTDFRIFYTTVWDRRPEEASLEFLEAVAKGFDDSVRHFRDLGLEVDPIYFLITAADALIDPEDPLFGVDTAVEAEAVGEWINANQPCPIMTFNAGIAGMVARGEAYVKHLTAHEVFHCIQKYNFPRQESLASAKWWAEGTAEYFAAAIYPCENIEHENSVLYSGDASLIAQDYPSVAFFQDLGQRSGGETGILSFIRAMATSEGMSAQQAALSSYSGIDRKFHKFAKDFIDSTIPDCGPDGRMPVTSELGEMRLVDDEDTVEIEVDPFKVKPIRLKLKKGRVYTITKSESASGKISYRDFQNTGDWKQIPEKFTTPCDEETIWQVVATTTPPGDTDNDITLRFESEDDLETEGCEACRDTGYRDRCILGTWEADTSDMERWLRETLSMGSGDSSSIELDSFSGSASFTAVDVEGLILGTLSGIEARGRFISRHRGEVHESHFKFEGGGQSTSNWSTERGGSRFYLCPVDSNVAFAMTVTSDGHSMTVPVPATSGGDEVEFDYRCDETSLTITHRPGGLPVQEYSARRVEE